MYLRSQHLFRRFAMGKLGILSFVDTLLVLRHGGIWRQNKEADMPIRPAKFGLGGESRRAACMKEFISIRGSCSWEQS